MSAPRQQHTVNEVILLHHDVETLKDGVNRVLEAVRERSTLVDVRDREIRASLEALDKLVRGNGVEGLVTKVNTLIQQNKSIEEKLKVLDTAISKILWWVIGILTASLGMMLAVFVIGKLAGK